MGVFFRSACKDLMARVCDCPCWALVRTRCSRKVSSGQERQLPCWKVESVKALGAQLPCCLSLSLHDKASLGIVNLWMCEATQNRG